MAKIRTNWEKPNDFVCKNCGVELGVEYRVKDKIIGIRLGGMMITESAHGRCVSCGFGIHIGIPHRSYVKLMKHYGDIPDISIEYTSKDDE